MKNLFLLTAIAATSLSATAGPITTYTNLSAYQAALAGATETVETFGAVARFPITTGSLNSATSLVVSNGPAITPGLIQTGATYSTLFHTDNFFNIDEGAGFAGGFLDGAFADADDRASGRRLTVAFDVRQGAFGFPTNQFMGTNFDIQINFASGNPFEGSFSIGATVSSAPEFFGSKPRLKTSRRW